MSLNNINTIRAKQWNNANIFYLFFEFVRSILKSHKNHHRKWRVHGVSLNITIKKLFWENKETVRTSP